MIDDLHRLLAGIAPADLLPARRAAETERILPPLTVLQAAALGEGDECALMVLEDSRAVRYGVPAVIDGGRPRRARAGDGVAERLIRLLAAPESSAAGLEVMAFHSEDCMGERHIDVDQTNELVVVGDKVVVKWVLHPTEEDQPAPRRLTTLARAGFTGTPRLWGLVTLREGGRRMLMAMAVEYVPDAEDGWDWAVDDVRRMARGGVTVPDALMPFRRVARLVAGMHAALGGGGTDPASESDVDGWLERAALDLEDSALPAGTRVRVRAELDGLAPCVGTPIMDVHGDLHIGQILRSARTGEYYVIDFDGNPMLSAAERLARQPAARDVAGMLASLDHVGRVVLHRTEDLDEQQRLRVLDWIEAAQSAFLEEYRATLTETGAGGLLDERLIHPFQVQQECREYAYARRYLPHWTYVPDAALPALLDRGPS